MIAELRRLNIDQLVCAINLTTTCALNRDRLLIPLNGVVLGLALINSGVIPLPAIDDVIGMATFYDIITSATKQLVAPLPSKMSSPAMPWMTLPAIRLDLIP